MKYLRQYALFVLLGLLAILFGAVLYSGKSLIRPFTSTTEADGFSIEVDVGDSWGELPHFWSRAIGTGHAYLVLDQRLQDHLTDAAQNLGMRGVRHHGILNDDVGIYSEPDGVPTYTWDNFDDIYDFLLSLDMYPIVELGFMPSALAEDPSLTIMNYNAIVSQPKDYALWGELTARMVSHLVDRYGEEAVDKMRFEVWNEPDLENTGDGGFWGGDMHQYFALYDHAAEAMKAVYPDVKVGGPTPSGYYKRQYLVDFLNHVSTANYATGGTSTPIDFVSYHTWHDYRETVEFHFFVLETLNGIEGFHALETYNTELGPTWQFGLDTQPHETETGAAFFARIISEITRRVHHNGVRYPDAYAWWVVSDVFEEETYVEDRPFISCMGLITREGIRKPIYNMFKMLHNMGDELVSFSSSAGNGNVNGFASTDQYGAVKVIVFNSSTDHNHWDYTPGDDNITITIKNLNLDEADYSVTMIDEHTSNAYTAWEDMGRPNMEAMSDEDWQTLRAAMDLETVESEDGIPISGGTFSRTITLAREGIMQISLVPNDYPVNTESSGGRN